MFKTFKELKLHEAASHHVIDLDARDVLEEVLEHEEVSSGRFIGAIRIDDIKNPPKWKNV